MFFKFKKFDGRKLRKVNLSEIGQIAGRTGRYLNDCSFRITGIVKICREVIFGDHKLRKQKLYFWKIQILILITLIL